ncbi:MAG: sulfite exporter TauE/SafE family protein [Actinomycetota bacterium]
MTFADGLIAVVAGVAAGAYAGLLGVGGGIVMVPAMVLLLDQSQTVAEGTSLLAIVGTALIAARAHQRKRLIIPKWARMLAAGGVGGAALGSFLAVALIDDEDLLRRIFGAFLLVVAVRIAVRPSAGRDQPASKS